MKTADNGDNENADSVVTVVVRCHDVTTKNTQ